MNEKDLTKADKALKKFLEKEIEGISLPDRAYGKIVESVDNPAERGRQPAEKMKPWSPVKFPIPIKLTAAACFTGGVIFLSLIAFSTVKTPGVWNSENPIYSGPHIEKKGFLELTDSAGKFFRRIAESMNDDLGNTNL